MRKSSAERSSAMRSATARVLPDHEKTATIEPSEGAFVACAGVAAPSSADGAAGGSLVAGSPSVPSWGGRDEQDATSPAPAMAPAAATALAKSLLVTLAWIGVLMVSFLSRVSRTWRWVRSVVLCDPWQSSHARVVSAPRAPTPLGPPVPAGALACPWTHWLGRTGRLDVGAMAVAPTRPRRSRERDRVPGASRARCQAS